MPDHADARGPAAGTQDLLRGHRGRVVHEDHLEPGPVQRLLVDGPGPTVEELRIIEIRHDDTQHCTDPPNLPDAGRPGADATVPTDPPAPRRRRCPRNARNYP